MISFSWRRGFGQARGSPPGPAGGLLGPKALVPPWVQVGLVKFGFKRTGNLRSPFFFGPGNLGGGAPHHTLPGDALEGFIPRDISGEAELLRDERTRLKRGSTPPAAFWGPFPGGTPPCFSQGSAAAVGNGIQPRKPCGSLSPCRAKSWPLQAFKSEKISLNAERGVSLIRRGTAEAPRQARWVPRARRGWDHAGFAPRCRFSFPRSPADVPVGDKGLGRERSWPGHGDAPEPKSPGNSFPFLG